MSTDELGSLNAGKGTVELLSKLAPEYLTELNQIVVSGLCLRMRLINLPSFTSLSMIFLLVYIYFFYYTINPNEKGICNIFIHFIIRYIL